MSQHSLTLRQRFCKVSTAVPRSSLERILATTVSVPQTCTRYALLVCGGSCNQSSAISNALLVGGGSCNQSSAISKTFARFWRGVKQRPEFIHTNAAKRAISADGTRLRLQHKTSHTSRLTVTF